MMRVTAGELVNGGACIARLPDGRAAFVHDACPGDLAEIEVVSDHGRWVDARLVRVLDPSPERVEPPCRYAAECGGCQWQHVALPTQLKSKRAIVADSLERIGKIDPVLVEACVPSPRPLGYRNKIELVAEGSGRELRLGFRRRRSKDIIEIDECLLLPEGSTGAPKALRGALRYLSGRHGDLAVRRVGVRTAAHTDDIEVALWTEPGPLPRQIVARTLTDATRASGVVRVLTKGADKERKVTKVEVLSGRGAWHEKLQDRSYLISAPSFFQVNSPAAELLISLTLDALDPGPEDRVLDLYAGAGTFTVPLASMADVVAVESSRYAIADLRRNLERNDTDADIIGGDAARELPSLGNFDLAVVDPPRCGLEESLISSLADAGPRRIAYVSCDPATLARDAARLSARGYSLVRAVPIDLFPQTHHVETMALFEEDSGA